MPAQTFERCDVMSEHPRENVPLFGFHSRYTAHYGYIGRLESKRRDRDSP